MCEWLTGQGAECVTYRDPGDTTIGERIREILLSPEHERMGAMTEMLLFMASRAQLWTEKIGPATAAGQCVVMDWLARAMGAPEPSRASENEGSPRRRRGGNKRCNNRRLLDSGYQFIYPSFKQGYAALLSASANLVS